MYAETRLMRSMSARLSLGACALVAFAIGFVGCAPQPPQPGPVGPDEKYDIAIDTPAHAAESALRVLRAELKAIARHDRIAARQHMSTLRQQIIATDTIAAAVKRIPHAPQDDRRVGELVKDITGRWSAIIAHYADGLEFDQIVGPSSDAARVAVLVPARGKSGRALIRVVCVRGADGLWRVSGIGFATRSAATQPVSTAPHE